MTSFNVFPDESGFPDLNTKIKYMHQTFIGSQDHVIKKHLEKNELSVHSKTEKDIDHNMTIDTSREPIIFTKDLDTEINKYRLEGNGSLNFDMWPNGNYRYGLSSIKIINKEILDENDYFYLEIAGQRVDEFQIFDTEKSDEITFGITSNGNYFPGLIHHHIRIVYKNIGQHNGNPPEIGLKKKFKVQYTLIPLMHGPITHEGIMIQHYSNYWDQKTVLKNDIYTYRFYMNHPIFKIDVYTQNEVSQGIKLNINGEQFALYLTKLSPKHWQIIFGEDYHHTINFSRIDNCRFECNEDPGNIRYDAKSCQIYRICNEMFGLAFSK